MHMDIPGMLFTVSVSAYKCLMSGKVSFCIIHSDTLSLLHGKRTLRRILWIEAYDVVV